MKPGMLAIGAAAILWALPWGARAAAPSRPPSVAPCSTCHDQPEGWKRKRAVHEPVKGDQCLACHNPHASRHGSLLRHEAGRGCLGCHQDLAARIRTQMPHAAATQDKQCLSCHDPHASGQPRLLKDEAARLCASCHEHVLKGPGSAHPHPPVSGGDCLACHDPHVSVHPFLAKQAEPGLCAACHSRSDPKLAAVHKGTSLEAALCSACHAPHGSGRKGMLRSVLHPPFEEGACDACHTDPRATPAALRSSAEGICLTCHEPREGGHPIPKEGSCLSCHDPHASSAASLIAGAERRVCLTCHEDVAAQRSAAVSFHPVTSSLQECTTCHQLHTGEGSALLRKKDPQRMCGSCHAAHSEFSHPMGEGVADPSHPGRSVDCLSCHDPHGTPYPQFLVADPRQELCIRCHLGEGH